ncbi:MAG TPA: hypothetical protein VHE61_24165 [Opitutaceae bacterium]|nr:hypothetical protein [Opitutaceae bacterium]
MKTVGAVLLLMASAAILAETAHRSAEYPRITPRPQLAPYSDPAERSARERDAIGTFATGTTPGDRIIVVDSDRRVRFSVVGATDPAFSSSDTFQMESVNRQPCLATSRSGIITQVDIDHLEYSGDTYERQATHRR